jgi:tRNA pseudouridine38-40 synthase
VVRDLDAEAMHASAQTLIGNHDFTTFRSSDCQAKSPVKTLDQLDVRRAGDEIHIEAAARSFLHNQVRSMVGSLKLVGEHKWPVPRMREALEAKDRATCGVVAPPEGLYLVNVVY